MRVVFHIGAHQTDNDQLVRSLLKNREALQQAGILVPGPGRYRKTLRDVVNKLRGERPSAEARDVLREEVSDDDEADTLFLSNESFLCLPDRVLDSGILYARAFKSIWLRNAFPDHPVDFAIAMRDPATFVPALYAVRDQKDLDFEDYIMGVDLLELSWADVIERILEANPQSRVIAWCNEDTPLHWGSVMRAVTGAPGTIEFAGALDIAQGLLPEVARPGLDTAVEGTAGAGEHARLAAIAEYLEAHAAPEELEEEYDLPGWTPDVMDELSEAYEADVAEISQMPRVHLVGA